MMKRTHHPRTWGVRAFAVGAALGAAPMLAACDPAVDDAAEAAEASPSAASFDNTAEAESGEAVSFGTEDRRRLAEFDALVVFDGLAEPSTQRSPVDTAEGFYGSATSVVEPASCNAFHQATQLGSDEDLGAAAQDLVNPVGPFFVDGVVPEDGEDLTVASVLTRVFADPEVATTVPSSLLESECRDYTVTTTWDGGAADDDRVITAVEQVELPGLATPTVRIEHGSEDSVYYGADGEVADQVTYEPRAAYIHVSGPYAIAVEVAGVEDEAAQAARVIQAYLDHMGTD